MIQVIGRVEEILVYLSKNRKREVPLSEIADTLNMNRATCANILKALKEIGFIEQMSYRKGYVLGEKLFAIVGVNNDPDRIVTLLKPLLRLIVQRGQRKCHVVGYKERQAYKSLQRKGQSSDRGENNLRDEGMAGHNGKGHNRPIQFRETQQFP